MKNIFLFLFVFSYTTTLSAQLVLSAKLKDTHQHPIANAYIIENETNAVLTDDDGKFSIKLNSNKIEIHHLAYKSKYFVVNENDSIFILDEHIENADEIIVYGKTDKLSKEKWLSNLDQMLRSKTSIFTIDRANFSSEIVIRGLNPQQSVIVIDGMKMFSACIDKMDPVTNYIESENLKKIEIKKNNSTIQYSSNLGAEINYVTEKAQLNQKSYAEFQSAYESVAHLWHNRIVWASNFLDDYNYRISLSNKTADDFYSGDKQRIAQSGFEKYNWMLSVTKGAESNRFSFQYIGDNAFDIGYPKLLMDTRKTDSHLFSIEWNGIIRNYKIESKLYFNQVKHWMDDYQRDIHQREVMRDMYMPMFGQSQTAGYMFHLQLETEGIKHSILMDYFFMKAFSDMKMLPTLSNSRNAYVVNLADIQNHQTSISYALQYEFESGFHLASSLRADISSRSANNDFGKAEISGHTGIYNLDKQLYSWSFRNSLLWDINAQNSWQFDFSYNQRFPSHLEAYGFLLYNPIDGYFHYGNPDLKNEKAVQFELSYDYHNAILHTKINTYAQFIQNYIYGKVTQLDSKNLVNLSKVNLFGLEWENHIFFSNQLNLIFNLDYSYGENLDYKEPLLMIPPLNARVTIEYDITDWNWQLQFEYQGNQNRIAHKSSKEDVTNEFFILNSSLQYLFSNNFQINFAIENLLDKNFNYHLSVNNLPAKGRNVQIGILYRMN